MCVGQRHGTLCMSRYLLQHHHAPDECGVVFTSFKGHQARSATR